MTLIIENVKEEFLPAFKGLAEVINARLSTQSGEPLDMPTKETIQALENSHTVLKTSDYKDFEKMLENEQ